MGIREGRGRWITYETGVLSTATFVKGSLTGFVAGTVREYASSQSQALGIALANSVDSLPAGKAKVKVPTGADVTAWAVVPAGISASSLSFGLNIGIVKSGNTVDNITWNVSQNSALGVLTGRYVLSPISEAEFVPNGINWVLGASSAVTALA